MKEKLYSIPVHDAFNEDCECPICAMFHKLENDAVDYTMGPSYMEDDTRAMTDEAGFCEKHIRMVYGRSGRSLPGWPGLLLRYDRPAERGRDRTVLRPVPL